MKLIDKLKNRLKKFFEPEKYDFEKIIIERDVINTILELARMTSPTEFIAFLEGKADEKIKKNQGKTKSKEKSKVLRIYGLAYQEYIANENSTLSKVNFPITSSIVGSVHSHPGPSNRPSRADLQFFSKRGMVHLIIKSPYKEKDIQAYDINGEKIVFEVED